ncbi:MAG: hypothetical protein AAF541_10925 [Pseudomonadota bacterium]
MIAGLEIATVVAAGLLAGSLLTEARVLVIYWQQMEVSEFSRLHPQLAPILFRFFAPLTILGTALPITTALTAISVGRPATPFWLFSAACALALLAFYFMFFKAANKQFAQNRDPAQTVLTLSRWKQMHNCRTTIALAGFIASIWALKIH